MGKLAVQLTIKARRLAMGFTGKDFARKCGISAAYLSQLEKGVRTRPSDELLSSAAAILRCSVEELTGCMPAGLDGTPATPVSVREPAFSVREQHGKYVACAEAQQSGKMECRYPADCNLIARLDKIEAQLQMLVQLLGATMAASPANAAGARKKR